MERKKVVYIAGPYRGKTINETYENIQKARVVALKYWRLGYVVLCPHLNTALMDGACKDSVWLEGCLELLRRCDVIVMMEDWKKSEGSVVEQELAIKLGLTIIYDKE